MDINSLLSPATSPADDTPTTSALPSARASPVRRAGRPPAQSRQSSGLSQQYSPSPRIAEQSLPSIAAHNAAAAAYQSQQGLYASSSASSPRLQSLHHASTSAALSHNYDPRHLPLHPTTQRHGSTPQMDTLADLASMRQQHATPHAPSPAREVKASAYTLENLPRPSLSARSSNEIVMTDPSTQQRRSYNTQALSEDDRNALNDLGNRLVANPFDYASHVGFIKLLQQGLAVHVSNGASPRDYELLAELREARLNMDHQFPPGETLWLSWLDDEMSLARDVQERLRVMEFFNKALAEEPSSVQIWRKYGDYAYYLWATAYGVDEPASSDPWSSSDLDLGREYFKWAPMLKTWEDAVVKTHSRLSDSHLIWDQYIGVLIQDHEKWPDQHKVDNIKHKFYERLQEAHATYDDTFQRFGSFLTQHDSKNYEEIMRSLSSNHGPKTAWRVRETHEAAIQQAAESGDETAEYKAYTDYLDWELQKKGVFSFRMINSLFERACIRFPSVQQVWVDYIDYLIGDTTERDFPILQVMERATRHCPWSGDLWAHQLLTMEMEGQPFVEIEKIKHRATSTGLLDVGGMEELMKVYVAWCGGLRRRAFSVGALEDDTDIAEVAIRSALEHVKKIGQDKYGEKYTGDPYYRLERIYIKFKMQKGEMEVARENWNELKADHRNSYDFWYRLYIWEMVAWARSSLQPQHDDRDTQLMKPPEFATKVLLEALEHVETMDWPEQLVPMYLNHCEHHESVAELRRAVIGSRRINKQITRRREREQAEAAAVVHQQTQSAMVAESEQQSNGKRKRDEDTVYDETTAKKAKSDDVDQGGDRVNDAPIKRDREHTTVIVENIPLQTTERQIGLFFQDCGTIKSLKLAQKKTTQTATIEFETQEEASYSLMKSGKTLRENEITVKFGTGCTLYVTNYPPEADQAYLKELFKDCGEIVDIRLPSLKANTKRRFAYVQFLDPDQTLKATQLNGTLLDGKFHLVAAVADPNKAKDREGAQIEGREVFVSNVYWFATEEELEEIFKAAGEIASIRIPRNAAGKSKNSAFVVFKSQADALKAVDQFEDIVFKGRKLHVEISNTKKASRIATHIHRGSTQSPGPDGRSLSVAPELNNGSATSDTGNAENSHHNERTIAILNVPDTVTAPRLEKFAAACGEIKKFQLRPDHAGAIVEYAEVSSVGKAQIALDEQDLDGQRIRIGSVPALLKAQPEVKEQKNWTAGKKPKKTPVSSNLAPTTRPAARPSQPGRGGRGGKRGGLGFTARKVVTTDAEENNSAASVDAGPKSNDYFRSLVSGGAASAKAEDSTKNGQLAKSETESVKLDGGDDGGGNVDGLSDIMVSDAEDGGAKTSGAAPAAADDDDLLDDIMA